MIQQPQNETDHSALLALMLVGTLIERMDDLGQLDDATARRMHQLVSGVRTHAQSTGLTDLRILFDNIDRKLGAPSG